MRNAWILLLPLLVIGVAHCRKRTDKHPKAKDSSHVPLHDEARLYKHLTESYDRWNPDRALIPVINTSQTVNVMFGVALINFLKFDETSNIGTFSIWERYSWNDAFLKWQPTEFGGIEQIRLPIDRIWQPDIILFNGFDPSDGVIQDALAVVSYDGTVLHIPVVSRHIACSASDVLSCKLKYGSWTFDGFRLGIDFYDGLEEVDINDYSENSQFKLKSHAAKKNVLWYPSGDEPYPDLSFHLEFEKKSEWWGKKK